MILFDALIPRQRRIPYLPYRATFCSMPVPGMESLYVRHARTRPRTSYLPLKGNLLFHARHGLCRDNSKYTETRALTFAILPLPFYREHIL
jgi:hypothetical protein